MRLYRGWMDEDLRKLVRRAASEAEGAMLRVVSLVEDPELPDAERRELRTVAAALENATTLLYSMAQSAPPTDG
jgi:hypothetical protein